MKITKIFKNPNLILEYFLKRCNGFIPEELYLKWLFRIKMGKKLNLKSPRTFNEKLQWLKLYDRKPEYTGLVDKAEVKDIVGRLIGTEYIIPTIAEWDTVESIDTDNLPDSFVLKTTHGGGNGGVVICQSKQNFNKQKACEKLARSMQTDIYRRMREWPYKNIKKKIIAESFIQQKDGGLDDYKFFCFDGNVDCVMVCIDRQKGEPKFYFFDKDWNLLRLNIRGKEASADFTLPKPEGIEKMFELASKLSVGRPFSRVDLYNVAGRIYFGEITFFPDSGFDRNILEETDIRWGNMLNLPR